MGSKPQRSPGGNGPRDHGRDQRGSGGGATTEDGTSGRASGPPVPPSRRFVIDFVDQSRTDLRNLKNKDRATYGIVNDLLDTLEHTPDIGYELHGEWEGCRAVHCGRDRYRIIWEILPPEEDYEGVTDEVEPVVILRIGPKTDSSGRTIYDEGRPLHR